MISNIDRMKQDAEDSHQEVLGMIEALSEETSSDRASSVWKGHYVYKIN
jgi:hypothetical protein